MEEHLSECPLCECLIHGLLELPVCGKYFLIITCIAEHQTVNLLSRRG